MCAVSARANEHQLFDTRVAEDVAWTALMRPRKHLFAFASATEPGLASKSLLKMKPRGRTDNSSYLKNI